MFSPLSQCGRSQGKKSPLFCLGKNTGGSEKMTGVPQGERRGKELQSEAEAASRIEKSSAAEWARWGAEWIPP